MTTLEQRVSYIEGRLDELATKSDVASLEARLTSDVANLETRLTSDVANLETRLTREIGNLVKWMALLQLAGLAAVAGIVAGVTAIVN